MSELKEEHLQNDIAEAELLETKRGAGRPTGAKNKSTSKTEIRRRVALHRQRKREKEEAEAEAVEQQGRLFADMRRDGLLFFGETSPTQNCLTITDEIEMARIWARLLNVRDIQTGENQRNYILTVMRAWVSADCPLLHLESQSLSKRKVDVPEIEQYIWPEGSDTPYYATETETEVTKNA